MTNFGIPAQLQADLHAQGVLPDAWYTFSKHGRPTILGETTWLARL